MTKVFLVDDEIVIRESLRTCALWSDDEFVLVGEAADGEMALSQLQDVKPDVLITDIKMPFMDGLELTKQVRKQMPWMHVVILSGYDDFAFAKQAIALGVTDYLLKPVDETELRPVLQSIAEKIDIEKKQAEHLSELKAQEIHARPLIQEQILQAFLQEETNFDSLKEQARKARLNLHANCYQVLLMIPDYTITQKLQQQSKLRDVIAKLCRNSGESIYYCRVNGHYATIVQGDSYQDVEERAYNFAQTLQFELERINGVSVKICMGSVVLSVEECAQSIEQARQVAIMSEGKRKGQILSIKDMQQMPQNETYLTDFCDDGSIDQLRHVPYDDAESFLEKYILSFGENAMDSRLMHDYVHMELLLQVSKLIREKGGDPKEILPEQIQNEQHIETIQDTKQRKHLWLEMVRIALRYRDEKSEQTLSSSTQKAIAYLQTNYASLNISMREVACFVGLSNSHFCTVFSQETGTTFTEYLTHLRMSKAKELLRNTEELSQDIATRVGYNDRHYFSYLFKKTVGIRPSEYRKGVTVGS